MPFVHLHVHTEYSVLDGAAKISKLFEKARNDGQTALAITDHGNMFGVKEFLDTQKKFPEVKPLVGCEVYVAKGRRDERRGREDQSSFHLVLIAKNLNGYKNLIKLVSIGYIEGYYYKPRIDHEVLEQYCQDLICTTACLAGEVQRAIQADDLEEAENLALWYKGLFGEDFYLEVQRHQTEVPNADRTVYEMQKKVNVELFRIAEKHNIKVVATNDVHFVDREDGPMHDRLICLTTNSDYDDPERLRYTQQEYLKSQDEMAELFADHPEVLENTLEVADKVEHFSIDSKPIMPHFPIPADFADSGEYLRHLSYEGAKFRYPEITPAIKERIDFELDTIINMGFPDYFLIVQDFIAEARRRDVSVGPGRGSAAGSVVAYCLKITDIDPIKYKLLFERFLNPDRISMPDIDIDFDDEGRARVLKYVEEKYGKDHVSQVVTFGTMAAKSAIKDIARIHKLPLQEANALTKLVPFDSFEVSEVVEVDDPDNPGQKKKEKGKKKLKPTLANSLKLDQSFKAAYDMGSSTTKEVLDYAARLEGTVRQTGVHACAVLIGKEDLTNYIPISTVKENGEDKWVAQYEGTLIESVGLLKMDFLGLRTLSIIREALKNIKQSRGIDLDIDAISLDDKPTYELFSRGDTVAIFQFESEGMQKHLKDLKPSRFEDLIAMNALYRPGPMQYIPDFIARKLGREKISYDLPEMEEYLEETYGITVYQEQVMLLAQKLAGFSKGDADVLRKAMGKKQKDVMAKMKKQFFDGGINNGHPKEKLEKIWNDWISFAEYAFNKSHSTCYAWLGYQTAYLKANYPAEYMAASLSKNLNDIKTISKFMDDCRRSNIKVLGPDVNESYTDFVVNKAGNIRFGMAGIKGVGANAVAAIIESRDQDGPFNDIFEFIERVNITTVNKKTIEALAQSGAFDSFENDINRYSFYCQSGNGNDTFLDTLLKYAGKFQADALSNTVSLFTGDNEVKPERPQLPTKPEYNTLESLKREKELIGMYISAHPLDAFRFEIDNFATYSTTDADEITDLAMINPDKINKNISFAGIIGSVKNNLTKNNKPWCQFTLEDFGGSLSLTLFGTDYEKFLGFVQEDTPVLIKCLLSPRFPALSEEEKEMKKRGMTIEKKKPISYELRVESMTLLANTKDKYIKEIVITIPIDRLTADFRKRLIKAIKSNPGNQLLTLNIIDYTNKMQVEFFSRKYKVGVLPDLLAFLKQEALDYSVMKTGG